MATAQPLTFSQLLRRFRRAAGLTQEELAERAGLSVTGFSALERGINRGARRDTVELLAQALHLGPHEQALFEAAARGRPTAPAQAAPSPHAKAPLAGPPSPALPLVGRARELAVLERSLAATSTGSALLVAGEPGIGKTRLLQEAARGAAVAGWQVLSGGCTRRSGQEPYSPLLETIAGFLRSRAPAHLRADLEGCAWLVRLLPELAEQAIVPVPSWTLPPDQERRLMFAAVARFLANIAGPAGTLLVLDDLQWASADALHLLAALLQPAGTQQPGGSSQPQLSPLRLLGAYRSTEVHAQEPLGLWLSELAAKGLPPHLTLGPLATAAAVELIDLLLAQHDHVEGAQQRADAAGYPNETETPSATDLRQRVLQRAEGVPFFLVSCAQGMLSGALAVNAELLMAPAAAAQGADTVPWDVAQSIRLRVAALPEPARMLLGLAAVAGRVVPRRDLFAVALQAGRELPDDDAILAALDAVTHAGLLVETGDGAEAYTFAHDLIREVILTDLSAARREAWHRRVGEALERLPERLRARRIPELLWHYVEGDVPERALPYALAAGEQARVCYAYEEAERHFHLAAELARKVGDRVHEAEGLEQLGTLLSLLVRDEEALRALEPAAALYRGLGDIDGERRVSAAIAMEYRYTQRWAEAEALVRSLLATARSDEPSEPVARLYLELAWLHLGEPEGLIACERAAEIARQVGDLRLLGDAEFQRGNTLEIAGRNSEAASVLEAILPMLEENGHLRRLGYALGVLADVYQHLGRYEDMLPMAERAVDVAEQVGLALQVAMTRQFSAYLAYLAGDWPQAQADLTASMHHIQLCEWPPEGASVKASLGQLLLAQGDYEKGVEILEQAISLADPHGPPGGIPSALKEAHVALAEHELLTNRQTEAVARLAALPERLAREPNSAAEIMPLLAWAYVEIGEGRQAEAWLSRAHERADATANTPLLLDVRRVEAVLAIQRRQWTEAESALEEALALARAMPKPYAEAKALYVYGQLHEARGEPQQARENYEAAIAICERLGEGLYRPHIERALAGLG